MKYFKFLFCFVIYFFFACQKPIANFSEPQPSEKKNLLSFPKAVIGNYQNPELGYSFSVQNDLILRKWIDKDTVSHSSDIRGCNLMVL